MPLHIVLPVISCRQQIFTHHFRKSISPNIAISCSIKFVFRTCNFTLSNATTFDFEGLIKEQVNYLVIIGCISILLGYLQVAFWSMPAERQTRAIIRAVFRSILRKEIVYFDTHKTGDLSTKLSDDVDKIHDGIGDKLGSTAQFIAACISGLIIGKNGPI